MTSMTLLYQSRLKITNWSMNGSRVTVEASYIIENLSVEHQLVVDPFLGVMAGTGRGSMKTKSKIHWK